ncbi:MAG: rhodanese-like domain-containing protein [Sphaerobacter sp.]|nr:rhodanese-like domain-containing protein [Sphaerobacter sp.]
MILEQILRRDIGCAAYLVGSEAAGEAAVVDPRIDMVDEILALAAREGLRIRYVIETHNHADHVAGHHQLAARTGAAIAVHEAAGVAYPHRPLRDGDELALGEVRLRVIHTPGHRPEHIVLAVIDTSRGDEPWAVLTGDSLFIGDVARPDLAVDGREGAGTLFDSLHRHLLGLPEGTLVYPGHVAGSLCGRVSNRMTGTTIGFERRFNPALAIATRPDFVRYMSENLPERPPNMHRIVELNRGPAPLALHPAAPMDPAAARRLLDQGGQVLDVREPASFGQAHIPGAIGVWLDGAQFQNRVGLVVPVDTPLLLVAAASSAAARATTALAVIGYTNVVGYLAGGIDAWRAAGQPVAQIPSMTVAELQATRERLQVLDVREPGEWASGHIPGAIHIPFSRVAAQAAALDPQRPVAVICGSGERSMVAASLLRARGRDDVRNVAGGMAAWRAAGGPTTAGA